MRCHPWSYLPAVFVIVSIAHSSMAAPTYFTDRASFDAAIGSGGVLRFEGFENGFGNSRPPGYNPFNGFALLSADRPIFHATELGANSFSVTEGIDSAWFEDVGNSPAQFVWGSSVYQAFGLDITFAQGHGSATTATMTIGGAGPARSISSPTYINSGALLIRQTSNRISLPSMSAAMATLGSMQLLLDKSRSRPVLAHWH